MGGRTASGIIYATYVAKYTSSFKRKKKDPQFSQQKKSVSVAQLENSPPPCIVVAVL